MLTPRLSKQADDIITQHTDWVKLARELDVSRYERQDGHPDWHNGTPFRPAFLSTLWAKVEQESLSGIPNRLTDNPELADAFGFDPDDLPSESTFKPVRLNDRFEELQDTLTVASRKIRDMGAERGAPIGHDLGKLATDGEDGNSKPSERTIDRMLRKKGKEVVTELNSVAFPEIPLPQPDNAIYDKDELLTMEALGAVDRLSARGAGKAVGDEKNPEPSYDDPFHADGPTGETLLEAIKEMSVDEIAQVINFAIRKTYTRAKPRLQQLENDDGSRFGTRAKVALDMTYVAYYGGRDEMVWVQGAPDDKEYNWCHKFATVVIVGDNTHYVVGVCPLGSAEYADNDAYPGESQSYFVGDVTRRLLSIADQFVNIRMVYADREFHAADVIHALEERDLNYIIPAKKDQHRLGPLCDRFDQIKRGYDEEHDTQLYVEQDWVMHGQVKNGPSNAKVYTNIVMLPPDEDDETHEEGSPQPFLTNLDVDDEIALDRRWAREQMEQYSDRAAIENSYASIKKCAAWTSSKEFEVRWFHFAFGCLVYNMWLLVDFLTQERIGVIETRKKPRITLSRFLNWLEKEFGKLL